MGNELVVPSETVGTSIGGNLQARTVLVNQGGQVIRTPPNGDLSPISSFESVGRACASFKGRADTLSNINNILKGLADKKTLHERILVIHGVLGIGKSELMRRFAYVYSSEYPNIGWINAESPTAIGRDFAAISDILRVEWNCQLEPKYNVRKVYEHVDKHCGSNCLFIFDNVSMKKNRIQNFLPQDRSIIYNLPLIVMIANEPIDPYKNLRLEELTLSEAIEIFKSSLNLSEEQLTRIKGPLTELATLIGCQPLRIATAVSYFRETGSENVKQNIDHYIKQIRALELTK